MHRLIGAFLNPASTPPAARLHMNRRAILPFLLGAPILATAGDTNPLIDPEESRLSKLCSHSPKLGLPQLRDYLRKKLDVAYETALASALDADHRKAIECAQKLWLEFYEAQRVVASYNASGGSYAAQAAMEEGVYHLRHRIFTLITPFMQGWGSAPVTPALKKP